MADVKAKEMEKSFELFYKTQLNKILKDGGVEDISDLGIEEINLLITFFTGYHFTALKKLFPQVKDISLDAIG